MLPPPCVVLFLFLFLFCFAASGPWSGIGRGAARRTLKTPARAATPRVCAQPNLLGDEDEDEADDRSARRRTHPPSSDSPQNPSTCSSVPPVFGALTHGWVLTWRCVQCVHGSRAKNTAHPCVRLAHARRTVGIRMALSTTERLVWHCGDHTAKLASTTCRRFFSSPKIVFCRSRWRVGPRLRRPRPSSSSATTTRRRRRRCRTRVGRCSTSARPSAWCVAAPRSLRSRAASSSPVRRAHRPPPAPAPAPTAHWHQHQHPAPTAHRSRLKSGLEPIGVA